MKKKIIDLEILDDLEQSGVSAIALVDVPAIEKYWMAFRKEEFVEPNAGESEEEFLGRCIPAMLDEGKDQDQAVAMCYSMYQNMSYDTGALPVYVDEIGDAKKEKFAETYTDYPEEAVENAKRALAYAEENGWGDCGMGPGKARANQLANREPISEDTIARMSAFERHRQNSDTPYGEGCGKLMWDAWGGAAGVEWAARKLREIRGEEFASEEFPTLEEAVKRSEELGLGGEIHSHKTEDGFIYMPGASHEALEKALAEGKKEDMSLALAYFRSLKGLREEDLEFNGLRVDMETEGMDMEFAAGYTVYRYEGSVGGDTRDFCREMVSDGGFYTFEEIVGFNSDNPGFGPGGSDEYSIFHYKGGPNCKHHWQKYYVNPKGVRENKGPAPGKAGTEPYDMPNNGYMMSKLLFASEDQQILVGPVAVPDMEIVRKDPKSGEVYYVKFSKEVVQRMAEKFMRELRNDQTNIEHDNTDKAGSYIMETWIVENEEDKANTVYDLNVPVGTWCVKMRVQDPQTWKMVKSGELRGFSLEGNFMDREDWEEYQNDRELYNRVIKILKSS